MAQKVLRIVSAAAPLARGYTLDALKQWAASVGLPVEWAGTEGAYAIVRAVDAERFRAVTSYQLCRAPGAPRITLRLALIPRRWHE